VRGKKHGGARKFNAGRIIAPKEGSAELKGMRVGKKERSKKPVRRRRGEKKKDH